jgi:hypothetical protein
MYICIYTYIEHIHIHTYTYMYVHNTTYIYTTHTHIYIYDTNVYYRTCTPQEGEAEEKNAVPGLSMLRVFRIARVFRLVRR